MLGEDWSPAETRWENAPANDPASTTGVKTGADTAAGGQAELLGSFIVPKSTADGATLTILEGEKLVAFLNADTNGIVTFIITKKNVHANDAVQFASAEHSSLAPPTLTITTDQAAPATQGAALPARPVHEPSYSGPIRSGRAPDLMIEDFAGDAPAATVVSKVEYSMSARPADAPGGGNVLHLRMAATGLRGKQGVQLDWPLPADARDWSGYTHCSLWFTSPKGGAIDRGNEGGVPYFLTIRMADDSGTWFERSQRTVSVRPHLGGVWQPLDVPLDDRWRPQGDRTRTPNWKCITQLQVFCASRDRHEVEFELASLGLERRPTDGPRVTLQADGGYLTEPGKDVPVRLTAEYLPSDQECVVAFSASDFWKRTVLQREQRVTPGSAGTWEGIVALPMQQSGYFDVCAELRVGGRRIWKATRGVASLSPLPPEHMASAPASMFGLWPAYEPALGAGWIRKFMGEAPDDASGWKPSQAPAGSGMSGICCVMLPRAWAGRWFNPDTTAEQYAQFAAGIERAARAAADGRFPYYEVINEPNAHFWGPMEEVVRYHALVYGAIKRGDPQAKVGGPCPYNIDVDYIEKFLAAGGDKCIDCIVIHAYEDEGPFRDKLRALKAMLARRGLGHLEIVISEKGASVPNVTPEEQARLMVRSYMIAASEGVRLMVWHGYFGATARGGDPGVNRLDPDFNIARSDGTANPAFVAYGVMTRTLVGARFDRPADWLPDSCEGYEFAFPAGRRVAVVWRREAGSDKVRLPAHLRAARSVDIMGVAQMSEEDRDGAAAMVVTENPVYLIR
jgi:hypothetical protein